MAIDFIDKSTEYLSVISQLMRKNLNSKQLLQRRWIWLVPIFWVQLFLLQAYGSPFNNAVSSPSFLPVHEAFQFSGAVNNEDKATIHIRVAEGYYLYKDRLSFHSVNAQTQIGNPLFPAGIEIMDPFQNEEMIVFPESTDIVLPYKTISKTPEIKIAFQGCARAGLCYPPSEVTLHLTLPAKPSVQNVDEDMQTVKFSKTQPVTHSETNNKYFSLLSQQHNLFAIFGLFFIAGILLAFTPCVLPMVPILSATLASSAGNRRRTVILTIAYIVSMSVTYAIAGSLVGIFGETLNLQAWLQSPWVIGLFALLFVVLSLSMFGLYELQLPTWLQNRILSVDANAAEKRKGSVVGAGFMGICSALVVSPCITAPLVGALLYISSTQNALLGGLALFSLGLGMGVPLLVVGIGLGQCVPKSGVWMKKVKYTFGILMLAIAVWLLSRVLPAHITLMLWGVLAMGLAIYSVLLVQWNALTRLRRKLFSSVLGLILFIYGTCLIVGGLMGNTSFTEPLVLKGVHVEASGQKVAEFRRITTPAQLYVLQQQAVREHRPLMLDFYADWCESCKRMDHNVLEKPEMAPLLSKFTLIRFDITQTTSAQMKMMKAMQVFGAPTIILYGANGKEQTRQVGELSLKDFRKLLLQVLHDEHPKEANQ